MFSHVFKSNHIGYMKTAQVLRLYKNILATVHAMTKSFVQFCSAQDGESTGVNCLVFWAHCEIEKIVMKCQVYNKGIFTILKYFSSYEILECTVDSEWNGVILLCHIQLLSYSFIQVTKTPAFNGLVKSPHTRIVKANNTTHQIKSDDLCTVWPRFAICQQSHS